MNAPVEHCWPAGGSCPPRRAFTLVELLTVMAVIVVLVGLLTPAITTLTRGSQLTQSAQLFDDQLNLARQLALAKNMTVEVRLYRVVDPSAAGESANNTASGKYRAFQFFTIKDSGQQAVPLGKVQRLQPAIIIDSGSTLSSMFASPNLMKTWSNNGTDTPPAALSGVDRNYLAFRSLSNGSTNLTTASLPSGVSNWFLTLHHVKDGDARTTPPADFLTVQIDPVGGHLRTFHP